MPGSNALLKRAPGIVLRAQPGLRRRGELRQLRQARLAPAWSISPSLIVLEGELCEELDCGTVPILFAGSAAIALCAVFPLPFDAEAIEGSGRDGHGLVSNHLVASTPFQHSALARSCRVGPLTAYFHREFVRRHRILGSPRVNAIQHGVERQHLILRRGYLYSPIRLNLDHTS